ncbi:MAG: bifunctional lysylphosphatidylglycerol flippase/synthetase MprF [Pseudonocardia sp.]
MSAPARRWSPARLTVPVGSAGAVARAAPVTVGFAAALWLVGLATGSIVAGPAPGLEQLVGVGVPSLQAGRWWTPLTSIGWGADAISYLATTVLLLLLVVPAERRFGPARTAGLLAGTQVVGTSLGTGLVALGGLTGDGWAQNLATDVAVGASPAAVGVGLAASAFWGPLWRRRVRVVTLVVLAMLALYSGSLEDVLRLVAGLTGLAAGPLLRGRAPERAGRPSAAETRVLIALVVAASAAGPLIAALSGTSIGPLSVLRYLVLPPPPQPAQVQALCADPTASDDCLGLQFRLRVGGIGPAVMSLLPVVLLLVLADGLRRGRRFAWWGAVLANVVLAAFGLALALTTARTPTERLVAFGGATDALFYAAVATAVLLPLAVAGLLVLTRRRFTVLAPPGTYRRWTVTVLAALVAVSVAYVLLGHALRAQFSPVPGWADLVLDVPTRFLPPGYLGEVEVSFLPVGALATVVDEWSGVAFWAVVLVASLRVLRSTATATGDATAARELLLTEGGSALSWQATWPGNSYWFAPDGRAAVAYRVIGRIALTTGDPFGAADARGLAVARFARFCTEHAWTPCFYSVGEETRAAAEELGWDAVQVAEETVVALPELAFTGRKWQDVRTALNKAGKAGITAEWISVRSAPLALTDQIRAISEEWVADKGLPEMGFTLGGLDELDDEQVRCLVAVDADRTVHGVTSWLPAFRDGKIACWTLDFMRRRDRGFRGVMEFLIASAALQFRDEGVPEMSLSGAPLARLDRGEQPDPLQRLLDLTGRALEPAYGFRSLLAFKAKFQPSYRPLYMAYPDVAALPAIATAITRAYLPDLDAASTLRLLRGLRG